MSVFDCLVPPFLYCYNLLNILYNRKEPYVRTITTCLDGNKSG